MGRPSGSLLLVSTLAACAGGTGTQAAETRCPADRPLAALVAGSDVIVVGRMDAPSERLSAGARQREYVEIPVRVDDTFKGTPASEATLRFFPDNASYKPPNAAVAGLSGRSALLFLIRVDEGPAGLYFAGYTPAALQPASDASIVAAHGEIVRQQVILQDWHADPRLPHYDEVRSLISRLGQVAGAEQQRVFDRLQALGTAAVPAIVAQMDDRRRLRTPEISLANHDPNAFESTRQYGPILVVDALAAILDQLAGQNFGDILNGGSDRQRNAAVAGWRVYAADLHCAG